MQTNNDPSIYLHEIIDLGDSFKITNPLRKYGVTILKDALNFLYSLLKLNRPVFEKAVKAHTNVLQFGLDTNLEKAIGIDIATGIEEINEVGDADSVPIKIRADYAGKVAIIHNHPRNTPFSWLDLYTFGSTDFIHCLSIQCHDGTMYALIKISDKLFWHNKSTLKAIWTGMLENPEHKNKTEIELGEHFVSTIANPMGWEFLKRS